MSVNFLTGPVGPLSLSGSQRPTFNGAGVSGVPYVVPQALIRLVSIMRLCERGPRPSREERREKKQCLAGDGPLSPQQAYKAINQLV